MAEGYACNISINNRTSYDLKVAKSALDYGVFKTGPKTIPKGASIPAFTATGKPYTPLQGTEGTVVYQVGDDTTATVTIYFNVPALSADNAVNVTSSNEDIAAQRDGFVGEGDSETCTVKVVDGRD